jgi:hypothetical protein
VSRGKLRVVSVGDRRNRNRILMLTSQAARDVGLDNDAASAIAVRMMELMVEESLVLSAQVA